MFFNNTINALLLVMLPLLGIRFILGLIGKRVEGYYHCKKCGYNRAGIADQAACPECGHGPSFEGDFSHYYCGTRFTRPKRVRNDLVMVGICVIVLIGMTWIDNWRKDVYSRFVSAVEENDYKTVETYLKNYPELAENRFRYDPKLSIPGYVLTQAVRSNDTKMILLLLDYGADPKRTHQSLLWDAFRDDNVKVMQALLEAGADPNRTQSDTLLGYAAAFKPVRYTELLLDYGADPKHFFRYTVLNDAMQNPDRYEVCKLLLEAGADPNQSNAPPWDQASPLIEAIIDRDVETVELLLQYGADIYAAHPQTKLTAIEIAKDNVADDQENIEKEQAILDLLEAHAARLKHGEDTEQQQHD